jgi:integrase
MALQECIEGYLRSRGKRNGTGTYARTARSKLERWANWLGPHELSVADLNREGDTIMRRYAQHLAQRVESGGIAGSTANSYWSYIQAFCSYAQRDGILDRNPALSETAREELPEAATDRTDQQFWTESQREEIVQWTRDRAYDAVDGEAFEAAVERRDYALVCVLAYTGVRGAEVLAH